MEKSAERTSQRNRKDKTGTRDGLLYPTYPHKQPPTHTYTSTKTDTKSDRNRETVTERKEDRAAEDNEALKRREGRGEREVREEQSKKAGLRKGSEGKGGT